MANCQFCGAAGEYTSAFIHEPPVPVVPASSDRVGLKLVTCDFHLYHCAFFVCANCWTKENHLCKNPHPSWEQRIVGWTPPTAKKAVALQNLWRFRYGKFPAICTRVGNVFCMVCRTANPEARVNDPCATMDCSGVYTLNHCPACVTVDLKLAPDPVLPCASGSSSSSDAMSDVAADAADEPSDIDSYLKLSVHYQDRANYAKLSLSAADVLVEPVRPEYLSGADEYESTEVLADNGWHAYVATDIAFIVRGQLLAGVTVLLPHPTFEALLAEQTAPVMPVVAQASSRRITRNQPTSPVSRLDAPDDRFVGALLLRRAGCRAYTLNATTRSKLVLNNGQVKRKEVQLVLPPRGRGGSGFTIGRADGVGKSGIRHVLTCPPHHAEVLWKGLDTLKKVAGNDANDKPLPGHIDEFVAPPLAKAGYRALRTLASSSLVLYIGLPAPVPVAAPDELALELLRNLFEKQALTAAAAATALARRYWTRMIDPKAFQLNSGRIPQWTVSVLTPLKEAIAKADWSIKRQWSRDEAELKGYLESAREVLGATDNAAGLVYKYWNKIVDAYHLDIEQVAAWRRTALARLEAAIAAAGPPIHEDWKKEQLDMTQHLQDVEYNDERSKALVDQLSVRERALLEQLQAQVVKRGDPRDLANDRDWWLQIDTHVDPADAMEDTDVAVAATLDPHFRDVETVDPSAWPASPAPDDDFWAWNGRPLRLLSTLDETWAKLTAHKLARREYKDSYRFVMCPPGKSRKDDDRDQSSLFDKISAAEVALGVTNKSAAQTARRGPAAPEQNLSKPDAAFEWSHLIGDREGGGIHRSNLVASSRANNTEMLVIETVLQRIHDRLHKNGLDIVMRVEATLVSRVADLERDSRLQDRIRLTHYMSHVGDWMRYRVWFARNGKFVAPTGSGAVPPCPQEALAIDHILDCSRVRISKATARVFDYQVRFRMATVLWQNYGIAWAEKEENSIVLPPLGWHDTYLQSAAPERLQLASGEVAEVVTNGAQGDCLYLAVRDALRMLTAAQLQAISLRAGFDAATIDHLALRICATEHLRTILGLPPTPLLVPRPVFNGDPNQYGPAGQPSGTLADMQYFLNDYRGQYDLEWPGLGYEDWDTYAGAMAMRGTWGDMLMCEVLSHLLGVQIDIHHASGVRSVLRHELAPPPVLRLYNPRGVHFEALRIV